MLCTHILITSGCSVDGESGGVFNENMDAWLIIRQDPEYLISLVGVLVGVMLSVLHVV